MRFVEKDLAATPASLVSPQALLDIEKIANGDTTVQIKDVIYKGSYKDENSKTQSHVRDALNLYYHHKCAYCEDYCKAEIEHFRPKKAVTEDITHSGYYWLCYEWSNLLPSCRYCNTEGGKGNKFPLINTLNRIYLPTFTDSRLEKNHCKSDAFPLINEQPFLLNPEIDNNYSQYFSFKINDDRTGTKIIGIDPLGRGERTIEICNLNRNVLQLSRLEIYYMYSSKINTIFEYNANGLLSSENIEQALFLVYAELERDSQDIKHRYTLLKQLTLSSVENFAEFFSPYIENVNQREIAVTAFSNFKRIS